MGEAVTKACVKRGFNISSIALTGPNMPKQCSVMVGSEEVTVALLGPELSDQVTDKAVQQELLKCKKGGLIAIDFTHPSAVNRNADIYNRNQVPFVMGTTGGDRDALMATTQASKTFAVIAPNMCKQIVAFQAMLEHMASAFPGCFEGYTLTTKESHQKGKADTSGTAKDVVKSLSVINKSDVQANLDGIQQLRTDQDSLAFHVPPTALAGHAWHTYRLVSEDYSVHFEFKHNVNGRSTYAEGVADAASFLSARMAENSDKRLYNMIDVLQGGMT